MTPESQFTFLPNHEIKVDLVYELSGATQFERGTVVLTFNSKEELGLQVIAGEFSFDAATGVSGKSRTLSGILKMPPPHMVEFMSKHATTEHFTCAVTSGKYVLETCKVAFNK